VLYFFSLPEHSNFINQSPSQNLIVASFVNKSEPFHYPCIWGSSVSIVSDHSLDNKDSIPGRGKGFFLYSLCPERLWGPPSLLSNWYWRSYPGGKARPGHDTTNLHLVPRSRMSRDYTSSPPYRPHGVYRDSFALLFVNPMVHNCAHKSPESLLVQNTRHVQKVSSDRAYRPRRWRERSAPAQ
jgi:hypothetical protein